jgi:hypothetical protein
LIDGAGASNRFAGQYVEDVMKRLLAMLAASAVMVAAIGPAFAAHSDFDGIWSPEDRGVGGPPGRGPGGPGAAAAPGTAAARPPGAPRGGFQRLMPPYKPEWAAKYQALLDSSRDGKVLVDPTARCLPPGMPRTMSTPFPIEFSVEPKRVLMLFEIGGVRRIPTDGTKHPAPIDDIDPTFMGDSVGQWDGDMLVVDTVGLRADTVFDASGAMHSDKMHIVERIRLISPDKLEDHMTIDDPEAFTKPWEVTHVYNRKSDWKIMEFVCEENNRGVDPNGTVGFK